MKELIERMRTILLQATDDWKEASDENVIESSLSLLNMVVVQPNSLYDLYIDQYDILEDIEYIIEDITKCEEKILAIAALIERWKEFR